MSDSIAVHDLSSRPPGEIAALPIEVLVGLAGAVAEMNAVVAPAEARLNAGLGQRRVGHGRQTRAADAKDTSRIRQAGADPAEYVRTTYEVSGRAYGAWPSPIRRLFEPARTVKVAKPRYAIEARCEEAA